MTIKKNFFTVLIIFICSFFLLAGCSKSEDDDASELTISNTDDATAVKASVLDLPQSITGKSQQTRSDSGGEDGVLGLYTGVRNYAQLADMMTGFVKELMGHIIGNPQLFNKDILGQKISIPEDANDPEAPRGILVEKSDVTDYDWKVTLYFDSAMETPGLIARFKVNKEKTAAKGRIIWKMSEVENIDVSQYSTQIDSITDSSLLSYNKVFSMDITFDGISETKSLEIKIVQDLSDLLAKAKSACDLQTTGTADQIKEKKSIVAERIYDVGQPAKIHLVAQSNGTIITMYNSSYHPGWKKYTTDFGQDRGPLFSDERCIYSFRAKAFEETATQKGARVDLALPLETATSVDWTTDAFSYLVKTYIASLWGTSNDYYAAFNMMPNSAFFADESLLGFYDGTTFYTPTGGTFPNILTSSTDTSSINHLITSDFDLSNITVTSPADVVAQTITIE